MPSATATATPKEQPVAAPQTVRNLDLLYTPEPSVTTPIAATPATAADKLFLASAHKLVESGKYVEAAMELDKYFERVSEPIHKARLMAGCLYYDAAIQVLNGTNCHLSDALRWALQARAFDGSTDPTPKTHLKQLTNVKLVATLLQFAPGRPLTPDAVDFITGEALGDPTEIQQKLGIKVTPLRECLTTYLGVGAPLAAPGGEGGRG